MKFDADGNLLTANFEVRGALVTANATLSNGTATSLIDGDSANFLDIVEMSFACNSSAALGSAAFGLDLINDGTVVRHIDLPDGGGTTQLQFNPPLKQVTKNTPWNVDLDDLTGTVVKVGATLIKRNK